MIESLGILYENFVNKVVFFLQQEIINTEGERLSKKILNQKLKQLFTENNEVFVQLDVYDTIMDKITEMNLKANNGVAYIFILGMARALIQYKDRITD